MSFFGGIMNVTEMNEEEKKRYYKSVRLLMEGKNPDGTEINNAGLVFLRGIRSAQEFVKEHSIKRGDRIVSCVNSRRFCFANHLKLLLYSLKHLHF
jgi:hypothetical protein